MTQTPTFSLLFEVINTYYCECRHSHCIPNNWETACILCVVINFLNSVLKKRLIKLTYIILILALHHF